ncbi:MAG: AAA family ATPase [Chloroflexota bacterium]
MPEREHHTPLPLFVLVAGKPGSGKSTLARELARAENLGLPLLSRDALKAGMVETWVFAQPETPRSEIETDTLRSTLVPNSFDLFYSTIAQWLQAGVSLIAEYGFDHRSEPDLKPLLDIANVVHVQCECPDEVCQRRFMEREQREGRVRPDRLANMATRIAQGTDPWSRFRTMSLAIPMLRVNTLNGYAPTLSEITAFCHEHSIRTMNT